MRWFYSFSELIYKRISTNKLQKPSAYTFEAAFHNAIERNSTN